MSLPIEEEWLPIVGYEGYYEVSSQGRVRSLPGRRRRGGLRKVSLNPNGYLTVNLWRDNRQEWRYIHRLVAEAFCERGAEQPVVRHLDGDPTNNTPSNLAWGTFSENSYDTVRHGRNWLANKTHCKNGHELTEDNLYRCSRGRRCRICANDENKRVRARKREAAGVLPNHCRNGHEYTDENTAMVDGKRRCRACSRAAAKAHYWRKKAVA